MLASLLNFHKLQLNYFDESAKYLKEFFQSIVINENSEHDYINLFNDQSSTFNNNNNNNSTRSSSSSNNDYVNSSNILVKCSHLIDFNTKQANDKEILEKKLNSLERFVKKSKLINRAESTPFLNHTSNNNNNNSLNDLNSTSNYKNFVSSSQINPMTQAINAAATSSNPNIYNNKYKSSSRKTASNYKMTGNYK